ncbi:MAG: MGMT family protein [Candidatus Aenigmarchaeota archaeon]|nr:MGMT family protein [Candidatus Aenigmarchaeota archaeon]
MHKAYLLLKKVPAGKVTTYGAIAKACNTSPRAIGSLMRSNRHPEIYPCYKVVKSTGEVGGYCGKAKGKKILKKVSLLRKDGIEIVSGKVNIERFGHKF